MGSILVSESNLERAIRKLLAEAKIPIPECWSGLFNSLFIYNRIVPAFLEALKEIGDVSLCYGFDILNVCNPTNLLEDILEDENRKNKSKA